MINSRMGLDRLRQRRASRRMVSVPRQAPCAAAELLELLREFGPEHLPESLPALDQQALADNLRELGPEFLLNSLMSPPHRDLVWEIVDPPENSDAR